MGRRQEKKASGTENPVGFRQERRVSFHVLDHLVADADFECRIRKRKPAGIRLDPSQPDPLFGCPNPRQAEHTLRHVRRDDRSLRQGQGNGRAGRAAAQIQGAGPRRIHLFADQRKVEPRGKGNPPNVVPHPEPGERVPLPVVFGQPGSHGLLKVPGRHTF